MAEWSKRQVRQIWRAKIAEEQERVDEEQAKDEYNILISKEIQKQKDDDLAEGTRLRKCYRELVEKLGTTTYKPTEMIGGVEMPILTVSDLCRSTHLIFCDGKEVSPEDRKALSTIDDDEEVDQSWDDHDLLNARETDLTVQERYQAQRKRKRRLPS